MVEDFSPNSWVFRVMDACNNWFPGHAEMLHDVYADFSDPTVILMPNYGQYKGQYKPGQFVRAHRGYSYDPGDLDGGAMYEVVKIDELHTGLKLDGSVFQGMNSLKSLFIVTSEPPTEFIELCSRIEEWRRKNYGTQGLASESIDGYSYSKATDPRGRTWFESAFADELRQWRQPRPTPLWYARKACPWPSTWDI